MLSIQRAQESLGGDQITGRDAFLILRHERREQGACVAGLPGLMPDAGKADGSAQFPAERTLPARQDKRFLKIALGLRGIACPARISP